MSTDKQGELCRAVRKSIPMIVPGISSDVVVLADDLTGAADAGVRFVREDCGFLIAEMTHARDCHDLREKPGFALSTQSRGLAPEDAAKRIRRAAGIISGRPRGLIYKKMDSQLRGLPGLETEVLRQSLGLKCSFIAPANPGQGRVTRDSIHLVHGVPVELSVPGASPAKIPGISAFMSAQAGIETGHIYLRDLEQGIHAVCQRIEELLTHGVQAITFDAVEQHHLRMVAGAGLRYFPDTLLAGSAGLAQASAEELGIRSGRTFDPPPRCRTCLFICGSAADILHRQADVLVSSGQCREAVVLPRHLKDRRQWDMMEERASDTWREGSDLLIRFSREPFRKGRYESSRMLALLSGLFSRLIDKRRPDSVFFSGGDTASAVLSRTGAEALMLEGEALPGMVWGRVVKGTLDSVQVVLKPGAFGEEDDLLKLTRMWMEGDTGDE